MLQSLIILIPMARSKVSNNNIASSSTKASRQRWFSACHTFLAQCLFPGKKRLHVYKKRFPYEAINLPAVFTGHRSVVLRHLCALSEFDILSKSAVHLPHIRDLNIRGWKGQDGNGSGCGKLARVPSCPQKQKA